MDKLINIYGKLTDFENKPLSNGDIEIKDAMFESVYKTTTNANGEYTLEVKIGTYMAIFAVKDYGVNNLEYWGWNLPAFEDTEINMRIGGLELYAINAFLIQIAPPSMMIYFRPMSLKRYIKLQENTDETGNTVIDVSPDLHKDDINVNINGETAAIMGINRVIETAPDNIQKVVGYLIQTSFPEIDNKQEYIKINITLKDRETGETGEGSLFWQKPKSFDKSGVND